MSLGENGGKKMKTSSEEALSRDWEVAEEECEVKGGC